MRTLVQAGAVPVRANGNEPQFLLVTSQRGNWIFPKGIVEPGDSREETAVKEAREEAGIHGTVLPNTVGAYETKKWRSHCVVHLFLLRYLEDCDWWEESDIRERRWCNYDDALRLIKKPELRKILSQAYSRLSEVDARL